ncbi:MAG: PKD domain-containing protein [Crocinitomicaceae bacterium]|nr:PKD domain-containing protein [Crocinitomicaceae bacterium]
MITISSKKNSFIKHVLFCFVLLFSFNIIAQKDTLFWFAAPNASNGLGDVPIGLTITSYSNAANVTISLPANGGFTPITISLPANSSQTIDLSSFVASIESPSSNTVNNNGIKITSSNLISVLYSIDSPNNKELFSLKGNNALGDNFYTPFQKNLNSVSASPSAYSGFEIVATENNTTVLITPKAAITGHAANATFSIILNEGQTYSARDVDGLATTSLAGSIISSNKPIAVTLFEDGLSYNASVNTSCFDAIGEQLMNINRLGTKYIVQKGAGTNNDLVYILATQNGTNLTIHTSTTSTATISWGETHLLTLSDDVAYIESNKPIYVYHVSALDCELSSTIVPSVFCAGNYDVSLYRNTADDFGVTVYTRTGYEGLFTVNGTSGIIDASDFATVPGSSGNLKVAQKFFTLAEVPNSSFITIANSGDIFGLATIQGSSTTGYSYSFVTEYSSTPFVDAGIDGAVCANVGYSLNGFVGGGSLNGTWSSSGYGTFTNGLNNLINEYVPNPLDVFVNPVKIILTSDATCPSQKDTLYLTVNQLPLVNASADQTVCANNAETTLNGSIQGGALTGIWTTLGSGSFAPDPTLLTATYTPSTADITNGSVQLVLTSTNNGNCLAETDTLEIFITQPPVATITQDTIIVCANNNVVTLSGNISGPTTTGVWNTSGDGIFSPNNISLSTTYYPGLNDINNGNCWIYLRSTSNGNCIAAKDSVYLQYTPAPSVDAGVNQLICTNDSQITLNGSVTGGSTTGIWSGGSGSFSPSNTDLNAVYTPTASEINSGNIALTLTATNFGTCSSVNDVVQFIFVAPPHANYNAGDNCFGDSTNFVNYSLAGYGSITQTEWIFGDGTTSTNLNPTHFYTSSGQYSPILIVTNSNGCKDTISNSITIFDKPTANFNYSVDCDNNLRTVYFTDASTPLSQVNYWYYDFGGQGVSLSPNPVQTFFNPGSYTVSHIVKTINGCSDTINQVLQITPLPEAGFAYNFSSGVNVGTTYNFIDTSSYATSFLWSFGNGKTSTEQDPSTIYFQNGTFPVVQYVYDHLGCYDSTMTWVTINNVTQEINTLIPNVISPNGDGLNDVWKLSFIELLYPNAIVEIFNEWGQLLFRSEGYQTPWDGTYHNKEVPDGNYFYIINLNADVEQPIYKGVLLVLRKKK